MFSYQVNYKIGDNNQSSEDYVDMSDFTYNPSYQVSSWTGNADPSNYTEAENDATYECVSTISSECS